MKTREVTFNALIIIVHNQVEQVGIKLKKKKITLKRSHFMLLKLQNHNIETTF